MIAREETDLRERLNVIVGTPTIFVILGALAGNLTAWENYHANLGFSVGGTIFAVSIVTLLMGLWGLRLRIALTELSRCRALLSLEIARRTAGEQHLPPRHRSRRRRKHLLYTNTIRIMRNGENCWLARKRPPPNLNLIRQSEN